MNTPTPDYPHDLPVGAVAPAVEFTGYEGDHHLRIVGGRAVYETVIYWDGQRSDKVKLAKLVRDEGGLHTVLRYVDWETPIEIVER